MFSAQSDQFSMRI